MAFSLRRYDGSMSIFHIDFGHNIFVVAKNTKPFENKKEKHFRFLVYPFVVSMLSSKDCV